MNTSNQKFPELGITPLSPESICRNSTLTPPIPRQDFCPSYFKNLCGDILFSVIPPKARSVTLFEMRGFKLESGQWDEDFAQLAFIKGIASEYVKHFGRKKAQAIKLNGNPALGPPVLGVTSDGEPYAWTPTTWK